MEPHTLYKVAATADEFEQIHRLNYQTFVGEIPQHSPNPEGRLVDKFHAENTYLIGVRNGTSGCRRGAIRSRFGSSPCFRRTGTDRFPRSCSILPPGTASTEATIWP